MKVKRVAGFLVLTVLLFSATGCIEVDYKIKLRSDGSGHSVMTVSTAESRVFSEMKNRLNQDKGFIKKIKEAGGTITERAEGGKYQIIVNRPFTNVSQLNENEDRYSLSKEGGKYTLAMYIKGAEMIPYPLTVEVELPGKILKASAGTIVGNKLLWSGTAADTARGLGITVEGRLETSLVWLIVLAVIIGAGLMGVIVYKVGTGRSGRMEGMIFCGQCGQPNSSDCKFCCECGAPL